MVEEEEGFNTRTAGIGESYYSLPDVVAHLNSLKESYKIDPLSVQAIVVQILNGRPVLRQEHAVSVPSRWQTSSWQMKGVN